MKAKQNMRRLAALTLATAVIIPPAEPALAASLQWARLAKPSLAESHLSTDAISGTGGGGYPLLTLPRSFRQKSAVTIPVVENGMETSHHLSPTQLKGGDETTPTSPIVTTQTGDSLTLPMAVMKAEIKMGDQTTEINSGGIQQPVTLEGPLEGELPSGEFGVQEGQDTAGKEIDGPAGPEEITDVTTPPETEGETGASGDVVMPPEAGEAPTEEPPVSTDPSDPADPESPVDPEPSTDPEPPVDPADPETPAEPSAPVGPEDPADPAEPTGPASSALPEVPSQEPALPEQALPPQAAALAVGRPDITQIYHYAVGFGVPLMEGTNYIKPVEYEGFFQVELEPEVPLREHYGARLCTANPLTNYPQKTGLKGDLYLYTDPENGNMYSYTVFPTQTMLGRLPDKVFEGWYIYPYGAKPKPSEPDASGRIPRHEVDVKSWEYGDIDVDRMYPMEPISYTVGDPGYSEEKARILGDLWDGMRKYNEQGYKDVDENGSIDSDNPVSFVGKWRYSDESRAADVNRVKREKQEGTTVSYGPMETPVTLTVNDKALPLYKSDIVGLYGDKLDALLTDFDRGGQVGQGSEYWLRVGADVDSLDLEFNAAEIFYAYNSLPDKNGEISPVKITWSCGGGTPLDYTAGQGGEESLFSSRMLPLYDLSTGEPTNSYDNPAYSRWTVTNIALNPSSPGEAGEGYRYNDITITVSPPSVYAKERAGEELTEEDRAKCTTYVFHVQRLTEPTLTQRSGNTPMGMIERDSSWDSEAEREAAAEIFRADLRFSTQYGQYPRGQENNGGSIFRDTYSHSAWNPYGTNVDLDPKAIVVYQNSAFLDPGISLTDSEGRPVSIGRNNSWQVLRRLELKTAEKLTVENLSKGISGWYKDGKLWDTTQGEILSGSSDQIDLRGLKVLPGIYTLEYELFDPVAGTTYSSDAASFATQTGQEGASHFRRTLVVLPIPGDVDMDGAVTSADAEILRKNLTDATQTQAASLGGVFLGQNPAVDLFAYRVADVDHDGTVDKHLENSSKVTDVDLLETLPRAQLISVSEESSKSDYYYIPLPSHVASPERQELKTDKDAAGAKLELVYLGKEKSRTHTVDGGDGYVNDPYGPWRSGGAWETGSDSSEKMELFETMWVGVKLSGGNASQLLRGKGVDTFTFSLVYDVRYLEPTSVLTQAELSSLGTGAGAEQRWQATLRLYNMGARSQTVWGNRGTYDFTRAVQSGRSFATYDSKAITPLEGKAMAEGRTSHLRELVFSISLNGQSPALLDGSGDQWLLAVPFNLIQHPVGQDTYQGVEMQAGMSDLTLLLNTSGGETVTAAYNPLVKEIFGGNTENLASQVTYANAGPEVPLGKDNSQVYYIRSESKAGVSSGAKDVVYSQYFEAQIGWQKNGEEYEYVHQIPSRAIMRYAPDWLHYDIGTGIISGIPEAAGTYYFTIAQYRYQLDVSPAPLHYWADSQNSYYGETGFRGQDSPDFTFRYEKEDIQSIDNARADASGGAIRNDGVGTSLGALLADVTYIEPTFTAVDKNGQTVLSTTPVTAGAYPIRATKPAGCNNYEMIYSPELADGDKGLSILPRPLRIQQLQRGTNVGMVYSDSAGTLPELEATLSNVTGGKREFSVQLMRDEDGTYVGLPLEEHDYLDGVLLPGDSLILQYRAELLRNEEDRQHASPPYTLSGREELRVAEIGRLKIIGGKNSDCYTIFAQQTPLVNGEEAGVVGTVRRRNIIQFSIVQVPPLVYRAGDRLDGANELWFNILKEGDLKEGTYTYNQEDTYSRLGVKVTWATREEMEAGKEGSLDYVAGQTFDMRYDGRYLCLSTEIGIDEQGNPMKVKTLYTDQPLRIIPRPLTLTAVEGSRFYGEENGELKYTYDPRDLSIADQDAVLQRFGGSLDNNARDGKELEAVLGSRFTAPKLTVVDSVETRVPLDAASKYTGSTTNAVLIEGARCDDYAIEYTYISKDGTVTQQEWGASPYSIRKRPIVVEALTTDRDLAVIYADARRIYINGLTLTADEVTLTLPEHTADSVSYYLRNEANKVLLQGMGYAPGSSAVVNGDEVSFTYRATMASQDGALGWTFAEGHFNMGQEATKKYPVQVENIQLSGTDANNYELVYQNQTSSLLGAPTRLETVTGCVDPEAGTRVNRYVPRLVEVGADGTLTELEGLVGQGTVTLRPIREIKIRSVGKVSYTYGESYAPDERESQGSRGMQIYIRYDTEHENYGGNVTEGILDYNISHYEDGKPVTAFDKRGLKIYYQKGTEEPRELSYRELLTIDPHDGARLLVAGKRGEQTELVWSEPSQETLAVRPRTLTLRADDHHRVYGESDPTRYSFTYNAGQLAPQDQAKLGVTGGWRDGGELSGLGLAYVPPVFRTQTTRTSDVRNRGRSGYPISISLPGGSGGSLANYALEYEPGTLYIYPRRVQLDRFLKDPIYTIYSDLSKNIVYTNIFVDRTSTDFTLRLPLGEYRPEGAPMALPMTGAGLVAGDAMTLRVQVEYPTNWKDGTSERYPVIVSDAELLSDNDNYELDTADGAAVILDKAATGKVELRSISAIEIVGAPDKLVYNYGETLDLTGLQVNISYTTGETGKPITNTVVFRRADDFAANGLYVNYYPSYTLLPEDDGYKGWENLRDKYYIADTGDHLTIAPTHGSMAPGLAGGDPKREFTANGKYLMVTAQRDSKHEAAKPIVVTDFATKQPVQIKVNPRPLTFQLKAEDKTYDGTTQAAGSILLENVYQRQGYVDANNRDVTDMVYPVTGADYEGLWGEKLTQTGNADFTSYVEGKGGYLFSTGSYAGPQTDPLGENTPIRWSEGYTYGGGDTMTFSFLDPNVAYATEPGDHSYGDVVQKPVQVTGLRLAGADAANYTLVGQVTQEDLAPGAYQGSALPTATIHKANRAPLSTDILPQVEVDPGTNVVRTVYGQTLSAIQGGEQSQYADQLHFEYALQYSAPSSGGEAGGDEATLVVEQWAGAQGTETWWDERYYGGEAVTVEYPEGYVPLEEDLPKPEDFSGEDAIRKGQSYPWAQEDGRFTLDADAYPGGAGIPWPGYDLYRTDRAPLERDRVYWALVRAAETHNYHASPAISSVEGYTPALIQAVQIARDAMDRAADEAEYTAAREIWKAASAAALEAVSGAAEAARAEARSESARLAEIAEAGEWPEDWTDRAPAPAVKTYAQSLELISVEELEGAEDPSAPAPSQPAGGKQTYQVPTLEAVWFTDVQEYPGKELMDAVVRNLSPVRYREYSWDMEGSALLFDQEESLLSLRESFEVEITGKDEQGVESSRWITVNEDNRARIYVKLRSSGGNTYLPPVQSILIDSGDLKVTLGADPVTLTVIFLPDNAVNRSVRWSSSDESVATVDRSGKVCFVGVGVAVITATSIDGPTDSITVTVLPQDWQEWFATGIFNVGMQEPFFQMDEGLFHPEWRMTRGEAAQLLFQFYVEDPQWPHTGPESYPDLTGKESYAQAALALSKVGVFQGLPDGRFGGDQIITRAEFIVLLGRMLGLEVPDTTGKPHAFLDTGEEDTWAYSEIDALSKFPGLVQGVGESYFAPTRSITRAEVAVFLNRLLQFSQVGEDPVIPRDVVRTHWAQGPILRAVNQGAMPPELEPGKEEQEEE